jgi:hypothetical protein
LAQAPGELVTRPASNYRRWWNNSWYEVEEGGEARAGAWTRAEMNRLKALVNHAHELGYWIRFIRWMDLVLKRTRLGQGLQLRLAGRRARAVASCD